MTPADHARRRLLKAANAPMFLRRDDLDAGAAYNNRAGVDHEIVVTLRGRPLIYCRTSAFTGCGTKSGLVGFGSGLVRISGPEQNLQVVQAFRRGGLVV